MQLQYQTGNSSLDNLFYNLVDTTYRAFNDRPIKSNNRECLVLANTIREIKESARNNFLLDKEDIAQELYIQWTKWIKEYQDYGIHPNLTLKSHLIRRSIWFLKDYITKECRVTDREIDRKDEVYEEEEKRSPLKWLVGYMPFNGIKSFGRYLLYLKDIEGLKTTEIGDKLGRHYLTIQEEIAEARKELVKN